MRRDVFVYGDWQTLGEIQTMGVLRVERSHGNEISAFEYSRSWLESSHAMSLDPHLQLYPSTQYLSDNDHPNFGLFLDSSADRCGSTTDEASRCKIGKERNSNSVILRSRSDAQSAVGYHGHPRAYASAMEPLLDQWAGGRGAVGCRERKKRAPNKPAKKSPRQINREKLDEYCR